MSNPNVSDSLQAVLRYIPEFVKRWLSFAQSVAVYTGSPVSPRAIDPQRLASLASIWGKAGIHPGKPPVSEIPESGVALGVLIREGRTAPDTSYMTLWAACRRSSLQFLSIDLIVRRQDKTFDIRQRQRFPEDTIAPLVYEGRASACVSLPRSTWSCLWAKQDRLVVLETFSDGFKIQEGVVGTHTPLHLTGTVKTQVGPLFGPYLSPNGLRVCFMMSAPDTNNRWRTTRRFTSISGVELYRFSFKDGNFNSFRSLWLTDDLWLQIEDVSDGRQNIVIHSIDKQRIVARIKSDTIIDTFPVGVLNGSGLIADEANGAIFQTISLPPIGESVDLDAPVTIKTLKYPFTQAYFLPYLSCFAASPDSRKGVWLFENKRPSCYLRSFDLWIGSLTQPIARKEMQIFMPTTGISEEWGIVPVWSPESQRLGFVSEKQFWVLNRAFA